MLHKILTFKSFEDSKGSLTPFELDQKDIPFPVKRVYLVTGKKGATRGAHAHKIEIELFVAISGSVEAIIDEGKGEKKIILDSKNKGLLVHPYCWHEFQNFSEDAVLLCFSSTHYFPGEENYITTKKEAFGK